MDNSTLSHPPNLLSSPSHNLEIEQMVLGAVIIENSSVESISDFLVPNDFYKEAHRRIFTVMLEMFETRDAIDLVTLTDALRHGGAIEKAGGASYLSTLVSLVPTAANIVYHARIIKRCSLERRLLRIGQELVEKPGLNGGFKKLRAEVATIDEEIACVEGGAHRAAVLVRVSDVKSEHVEWLWKNRIPLRKVVVLDGDPGLGKSTVTLDLAARVSRGMPMPGEDEGANPAGVILLSAEDGLADTIRPRLEAAGADLTRVVAFTAVRGVDGDLRLPSIPGDVQAIYQAARDIHARLIVVDPFMAFLAGNVKSHHDQDVRGAMHIIAKAAEDVGAALAIVRHLNKAPGGNPLYRGGGSIGIVGAARVGLLVAPDPQDETRRILAVTKSNLGPIPPSLAYRLVSANETSVVSWEGEAGYSARDLLAVQQEDGESGGARGEAEEFLRSLLSDGPVAANQVKKDAGDAGIAYGTLRRAADRLGVKRSKAGGRFGGDPRWYWSLPAEDAQNIPEDVEDAHTLGLSTFRASEHLQEKTAPVPRAQGQISPMVSQADGVIEVVGMSE